MNKEKLERIFRAGGVRPVERKRMGDFDIFIGDGFSLMPHKPYQRFGVDADEFPSGMFVTWWWVGKDEKLDTGQPMFFDVMHNPEYSAEDKKIARINAAMKAATRFIQDRKKNGRLH
jgi:hypothetical protein